MRMCWMIILGMEWMGPEGWGGRRSANVVAVSLDTHIYLH